MTTQYLWASRRAGNILLQQTTSRPGMSASLLRSQTMMSRCTLSGCVAKFKIPLHRWTSLRWAKLCDFFTYQSINWYNSWLFCSFPNNLLRLASVQASGKHASVELLGGSCEYQSGSAVFAGSRGKTMWIWCFCFCVGSDWWTFDDPHPRTIEVRQAESLGLHLHLLYLSVVVVGTDTFVLCSAVL